MPSSRTFLILLLLVFVATLYYYVPPKFPCNDLSGCLSLAHEEDVIAPPTSKTPANPTPSSGGHSSDKGWLDDQSDIPWESKNGKEVVESELEKGTWKEDGGEIVSDVEGEFEEADKDKKGADEDPKDAIKYLTYLPHSGFADQLIALVNALLLASYLNRTLLIPPAILGNPWRWHHFNETITFHAANQMAMQSQCKQYQALDYSDPKFQSAPSRCRVVAKLSYMPWDELFDTMALETRIPFVRRSNFSFEWFTDELGLRKRDMYLIRGEPKGILSQFYWDSSDPTTFPNLTVGPYSSYKKIITVANLARRPERLIHLPSVYGTGRVGTTTVLHRRLRRWIDRQFFFSHPLIMQTVNEIVDLLGGQRNYLSMHASVGDSPSGQKTQRTIDNLYTEFSKKFPPFEELPGGPLPPSHCLLQAHDRKGDPLDRDVNTYPIIFLATDALGARADKRFAKLLGGWPCVVMLGDIYDLKMSPIVSLVNEHDGSRLDRLFVPLIDGVVAAQARDFTRSLRSTFSMYLYKTNRLFLRGRIWVDGPSLPIAEDDEELDEDFGEMTAMKEELVMARREKHGDHIDFVDGGEGKVGH